MFVRQLIGREAGNIINMPYDAAQSCLAMGTVEAVTDEEIAAAGLEAPEPVVANRPDELPRGFRVEAITGGGYDLFDPGGVNISLDVELPNMIAARELAWSVIHPVDATPDTDALEALSNAELYELCENARIEISSRAKKADLIAALIAAGITAPPVAAPEGDEGSDEGKGGEGESQTSEPGENDAPAHASGESDGQAE
ncbi:hypothetical protein [Rhizobium lentis]|uniref:Uncharacterized protein n=1 Tax=Rhizobium lentis TaxID=1138194 RepID=A0A7W8UMD4_9HYPH|nr:hypothetical protein [Rhizobium lentis]MBB4574394.1 hypothetical protein [Rhizobium lentis]MBB5550320.1 hypothetical protein [Rhizobium lentis]MBB5560651.1 hypothetical protein [Rhizobium lentis]MBB5567236.1 hypothetical protein [Rhizobium lentis]